MSLYDQERNASMEFGVTNADMVEDLYSAQTELERVKRIFTRLHQCTESDEARKNLTVSHLFYRTYEID
ncbi:hypothetical protein M501DRAFT_999703 [Patellaria atrata CBS 101060]|uniref:Uncharacterized protein n=1 Tax=Patellaria atrata CBS 101060 TaxID=1346257 RepID=A0A9P4S220_9PEZI|nr:hypothetical protein M501DRAFT_999703 [Patellaria atrata CBS 101060]